MSARALRRKSIYQPTTAALDDGDDDTSGDRSTFGRVNGQLSARVDLHNSASSFSSFSSCLLLLLLVPSLA